MNRTSVLSATVMILLGICVTAETNGQIGGFGGQVIRRVDKGLRDFDQERLRHMSNSPRPGRDYTKVYIRNKTNDPVWVAVRYHPFEFSDGTTSELKSIDNDGPFDTHAWFKLRPGEKRHLANTANSHFYYYAQSDTGTWDGDNFKPVRFGSQTKNVGFKLKMIRAKYEENYTLNLTR